MQGPIKINLKPPAGSLPTGRFLLAVEEGKRA
jgi:hypothetical protein